MLEARILEYVRKNFVESVFTRETFDDYKSGLVGRKKKGFRDMNEEAEYFYNNMSCFALSPGASI